MDNCIGILNVNGKPLELNGTIVKIEGLSNTSSINEVLNKIDKLENKVDILSALFNQLTDNSYISVDLKNILNDDNVTLASYNFEEGIEKIISDSLTVDYLKETLPQDLKNKKIYILNGNYADFDTTIYEDNDIIYVNKRATKSFENYINNYKMLEVVLKKFKTDPVILSQGENKEIVNSLNLKEVLPNLKTLIDNNELVSYKGLKIQKGNLVKQLITNLYNKTSTDSLNVTTKHFLDRMYNFKESKDYYNIDKMFNYLKSIEFAKEGEDPLKTIKNFIEVINEDLIGYNFKIGQSIKNTEVVKIIKFDKSIIDVKTLNKVTKTTEVDVKKAKVVEFLEMYEGMFIYKFNQKGKEVYFTSLSEINLLNHSPRYVYTNLENLKNKILKDNKSEKVLNRANIINGNQVILPYSVSPGRTFITKVIPEADNVETFYHNMNYSDLYNLLTTDEELEIIQEIDKLTTTKDLLLYTQIIGNYESENDVENTKQAVDKILKTPYKRYIITNKINDYKLNKYNFAEYGNSLKVDVDVSSNVHMFEIFKQNIKANYENLLAGSDIIILTNEQISDLVDKKIMNYDDKAFIYDNNIYINPYFANYSDLFHELLHIGMNYLKSTDYNRYEILLNNFYDNNAKQVENFKKIQKKYPGRSRIDLLEELYVNQNSYNQEVFNILIGLNNDLEINGFDVLLKLFNNNTVTNLLESIQEQQPFNEFNLGKTSIDRKISNYIQQKIQNKEIIEKC